MYRKNQQNLVFVLTLIVGLLISTSGFAQQKEGETARIKIMKEQDGKMITIDTTITLTGDNEVEELLKQMGVKDLDLPEMGNVHKEMETEVDEDGKTVMKKKIIIKQKMDDQNVEEDKPFLGVILVEKKKNANGEEEKNVSNNIEKGIKIQDVVPESAAAQAGLKSGDVITAINGKMVMTEEELVAYIGTQKVGNKVTITYERDGKMQIADATLTAYKGMDMEDVNILDWYEKGSDEGKDVETIIIKKKKDNGISLGIWVEEDKDRKGIIVANVFEGSAAAQAGIKEGDVITKLDDTEVNSLEDIKAVLGAKKDGDALRITYERDGKTAIGNTTLKADLPKNTDAGETGISKWGRIDMGKFSKELEGVGKDISKLLKKLGESVENAEKKSQRIIIKDKDGTIIEKEVEKDVDEIIIEGDSDNLNITEVETVTDENGKQKRLKVKVVVQDVAEKEMSLLENESIAKTTVDKKLAVERLSFFPNPSKGVFELSFTLPESGTMTVRIVDAAGKEVFKETKLLFSGQYNKQLDISNNTKGIYFVQIIQNNKVLNKKIVVQ